MEVSECRFEGERRRLVLKLNFEAGNAPISGRRTPSSSSDHQFVPTAEAVRAAPLTGGATKVVIGDNLLSSFSFVSLSAKQQ
jgi:hypothetical protein